MRTSPTCRRGTPHRRQRPSSVSPSAPSGEQPPGVASGVTPPQRPHATCRGTLRVPKQTYHVAAPCRSKQGHSLPYALPPPALPRRCRCHASARSRPSRAPSRQMIPRPPHPPARAESGLRLPRRSLRGCRRAPASRRRPSPPSTVAQTGCARERRRNAGGRGVDRAGWRSPQQAPPSRACALARA